MFRYLITYQYIHAITGEKLKGKKIYSGTYYGAYEYAHELQTQGAYDIKVNQVQ